MFAQHVTIHIKKMKPIAKDLFALIANCVLNYLAQTFKRILSVRYQLQFIF